MAVGAGGANIFFVKRGENGGFTNRLSAGDCSLVSLCMYIYLYIQTYIYYIYLCLCGPTEGNGGLKEQT